jgi:hypothetical protein
VADPVHGYVQMTQARSAGEAGEREIVDTPWIQRMRRIRQLQTVPWVFPAAEHSRFQHLLGTMHLAGIFAKDLYPSLERTFPDGVPSANFVEETARLAGLLHDVGHGPFGHFFDDHFLSRFGITHEIVGQRIVSEKLGGLLSAVRRSPTGPFGAGEKIDPAHIAFLIRKPDPGERIERTWLSHLRELFCGTFTVDNMDYVMRDLHNTGIHGDVDPRRILFYTFYTREGLAIHRSGTSALAMFLNVRTYLYEDAYYHRAARAMDLHMTEIFRETMDHLFPGNPLDDLDAYRRLTDWYLIETVLGWKDSTDPVLARLGGEWDRLVHRDFKWHSVYERSLSLHAMEPGTGGFVSPRTLEERIRSFLPESLKGIEIRVDMPTHDPRPQNPWTEETQNLLVYDPATGKTSSEPLRDVFKNIPARIARMRVFATDRAHARAVAAAAEKALRDPGAASHSTNV